MNTIKQIKALPEAFLSYSVRPCNPIDGGGLEGRHIGTVADLKALADRHERLLAAAKAVWAEHNDFTSDFDSLAAIIAECGVTLRWNLRKGKR